MSISRRAVMGAMAGMPLLAGGCSILSSGGTDDRTLRINYGGSANNTEIPSSNPIQDTLSEQVGFDVVSERSPEDLGAALAGGQAPDVFLTSRSQLRQYDQQDLLLDLAPYRDRLADYEAFVGTSNVDTAMVGDRLVGVVRKPREFSYTSLWVRADWLDQLGLDMPSTLDEFTEVLRAFDEERPGRSDAVAFTGAGLGAFDLLFGAFGAGGLDSLYARSGEVTDGYNDPAILEPIEYVRSLIDEGLVDPDLFTLKGAESRDRAFQGSAGVVAASWDQMLKPEFVKAQKAAQPDSEWQMIDVLASSEHSGGMPTSPFGAVQGMPASLADDEERLTAMLDLLNYICTPEGSRLVMFGLEGTHFTLSGDKVEALPALDEEGSYFFAYQIAGRDEDSYLDVKFDPQRVAWEACRARDQVVQYEALVAPPEGFNTADAARFGNEQAVLFLTGERNLDTYPAFLDELNGQFDYASFVASAKDQLAELGLPE